ncbi:MAG: trypsin-like peptidase domain-containing protein [Candidatus Moraniibacteriota bacterium]|nr:MAG: trypsin-like peptidase domain-containing protein [Candidatus Moranbacteria bacterium]
MDEEIKQQQVFNKGSFLFSIVLSILSGILGGVFVLLLANPIVTKESLEKSPLENNKEMESSKTTVIAEDDAIIQVVEKVSPSVVSIVVTKDLSQMQRYFSSPFDMFFGGDPYAQKNEEGPSEMQQIGGGTGFFVSSEGMVVTNAHVVEDTSATYTVVTQSGDKYEAKILATDPTRDVAVIKVEGTNFPVAELGDSEALRLGQTVVAIGYSLGEFANSVSKGIISGTQRSIFAGSSRGQSEQLSNVIQTDAAINPGNSGGPLLNIQGKVIGVNVAMAQGAENIGFALPINSVRKVIDQVRETGKIVTPFLGIRYLIINEEIAKKNNLEYNYGALIMRGEQRSDLAVMPASPADRAGLKEGDVILEIAGEKITEEKPLNFLISEHSIGEEVAFKVWSDGEIKDMTILLEARKEDTKEKK